MFIVLLRFSDHRDRAGELMPGHRAWIQRGFDDGVFMLAGSLQPDLGGAVLAHRTSLAELRDRVGADPFVIEGVVRAEIFELTPTAKLTCARDGDES